MISGERQERWLESSGERATACGSSGEFCLANHHVIFSLGPVILLATLVLLEGFKAGLLSFCIVFVRFWLITEFFMGKLND